MGVVVLAPPLAPGREWRQPATARLEAAGVANDERKLRIVGSLMMIAASEYYQTNATGTMANPKAEDHAAAQAKLTLGHGTPLGRLMNCLDVIQLAKDSRKDLTTMINDFEIGEPRARQLRPKELQELSSSVLQAHQEWLALAENGVDPNDVTVRQSPFFPVIETCKCNGWSGKDQKYSYD